jgi:geranylgeranylglycerol-phosphate geranylgeranyltransferase
MVALAVAIGALIAGGFAGFEDNLLIVGLACLVAFLFTGAGNSLNDYFDRDIDRVNHPMRPIPQGRIRPESAIYLAFVLFFISLSLALFINNLAFLIVVANTIVMLSYEVLFKARGLAGNFTISWLTGTTFLFGGATVLAMDRILILAPLAFLATLGREIAKDIEDIEGDIGRFTLPMKVGVKSAGIMASIAIAIAILMTPIPILIELFSKNGLLYYIPAIVVADGIFIYCISLLVLGKSGASTALKGAMLIALMAFLAGGVL